MNTNLNCAKSYTIKQFKNSYAVWFKPSQTFLLLKKPAYDVLKQYSTGIETNQIINYCTKEYGHVERDISSFVSEIIQSIQFCNNPKNKPHISQTKLMKYNWNLPSLPLRYTYLLNNKQFSIAFSNESLKQAIHPLYAHLTCTPSGNPNQKLECFEVDNMLIARLDGKIIEVIKRENIEYFTGGIKQLIYSLIYHIDYNEWLGMLHASGIAKNNKSILFSAASGSGKSTIAALLKAQGYTYLSDDLIGVDKSGKAYPFPAAISIKEGAVKALSTYYPEIENMDVQTSFIGKKTRYLPVFDNCNVQSGFPVKAFVFVNYSTTKPFVFEEVDKEAALQLLLCETWVNPKTEFVTQFFNWIEETPFYRLQYSDNKQALQLIEKLFAQ